MLAHSSSSLHNMGLSNAETVTRKARSEDEHQLNPCTVLMPDSCYHECGLGRLLGTAHPDSGPSRETRHVLVTVASVAENVDREWTFPFKDCALESHHKEPGGFCRGLLASTGMNLCRPLGREEPFCYLYAELLQTKRGWASVPLWKQGRKSFG